jgi:hypothetical protein
VVPSVYFSVAGEQKQDGLRTFVRGRKMQRSLAIVCFHGQIRLRAQQESDNIVLALLSGILQRSRAASIPGIYVGAFGQE